MVLNPSNGARDIRFAVDDVPLVNDHGWNLRDAEAPGIGDALICGGHASLQRRAALLESLLHDECRVRGIAGELGGEFPFDEVRRVELDNPCAPRTTHRVLMVRDDQNL